MLSGTAAPVPSPELPTPPGTASFRMLALARKLTLHADKVKDQEVARLKDDLGEKQLVALVQLLAYANFQEIWSLPNRSKIPGRSTTPFSIWTS